MESVDIVYHHPATAGWKIRVRRANFLSLLRFGVSEINPNTVFVFRVGLLWNQGESDRTMDQMMPEEIIQRSMGRWEKHRESRLPTPTY
jgi:hypothetical protein